MIGFNFGKRKAQKLHDAASALHDAGNIEEAIATYKLAIEADPKKSGSYYNLGLIYKYRSDWENSREFNRRACELSPESAAARWNLAIAATALRDWSTARQAWKVEGLKFACEEGPINSDFGQTPVRLHPNDNAEVVWARRIDPVRARIESIPMPESGYRCGDVVLHDGAAVGYRMLGERECPVFNVLELFEPSGLSTFALKIDLETHEVAEQFLETFLAAGIDVEDWTASFRMLCKQCSEGRPHQQHDHHESEDGAAWTVRRQIGIAAPSSQEIEAVLASWTGTGVSTLELRCELDASTPATDSVVAALEALAQQDHFAADGMLYAGMQDAAERKRLNGDLAFTIDKFKAAYQGRAPKAMLLTLLASEVARYPRGDTEDAERLAMVFEKIMDCIGLESSEGILNSWMYGFDPAAPLPGT